MIGDFVETVRLNIKKLKKYFQESKKLNAINKLVLPVHVSVKKRFVRRRMYVQTE
jgi:hypothetical protein